MLAPSVLKAGKKNGSTYSIASASMQLPLVPGIFGPLAWWNERLGWSGSGRWFAEKMIAGFDMPLVRQGGILIL